MKYKLLVMHRLLVFGYLLWFVACPKAVYGDEGANNSQKDTAGSATCSDNEVGSCSAQQDEPRSSTTTAITPRQFPARAPHDRRGGYLQKMRYDVGLGVEHALVYTDLTSNATADANREHHDGRRLCKMYNLSSRKLHLIRQDDETKKFELLNVLEPVHYCGVTCTAGDHYIFLDRKHPQTPTHEVWIPDNNERHFVYKEPYEALETNLQRERYIRFHRGLLYEDYYRKKAGRSYLASSYPPRPPPQHPIWPADYVGQQHIVELDGVSQSMLVLSTAPRILVMNNFVTAEERKEIQTLAEAEGFSPSTTLSPNDKLYRRTSETSWLLRNQHPVLGRLYRRTAQLLRMPNMTTCCAEDLQVVHYDEKAEYRAHFDFKLPGGWAEPARFATVLIYLEDCPLGGKTVFPLAAGGPLSVPPQAGTALLFYSLLPDGNVDELSLHASAPVEKGTKRVANIWV